MTSPLLLYVNIPFCNSKCHFCDWVVRVPVADLRLGPEAPGRSGHLSAVQTQIAAHAPALAQRYRPEIMYWGGGTASILSCGEIETLYSALDVALPLHDIVEATIESSPETLTPEKLRLFRDLGFDRISIGVQSFDDQRLRMIGRAHSADVARTSVELAREAGFDNINIDLIVGFPEQDPAEVDDTVRAAVALPVNHFSIYPYRASQGTVLRRRLDRSRTRPDMRRQVEAYEQAERVLNEHGFHEYSFGYFGEPVCVADMSYYQMKTDWAGFGSGAYSVLGQRVKGYVSGNLHRYIADPTTFDYDRPLSVAAETLNFISIALTTPEGVDRAVFEERMGIPLAEACADPEVREYLDQLAEYGRFVDDERGLRIERADIARTFIMMNWIDSPAAAAA